MPLEMTKLVDATLFTHILWTKYNLKSPGTSPNNKFWQTPDTVQVLSNNIWEFHPINQVLIFNPLLLLSAHTSLPCTKHTPANVMSNPLLLLSASNVFYSTLK